MYSRAGLVRVVSWRLPVCHGALVSCVFILTSHFLISHRCLLLHHLTHLCMLLHHDLLQTLSFDNAYVFRVTQLLSLFQTANFIQIFKTIRAFFESLHGVLCVFLNGDLTLSLYHLQFTVQFHLCPLPQTFEFGRFLLKSFFIGSIGRSGLLASPSITTGSPDTVSIALKPAGKRRSTSP